MYNLPYYKEHDPKVVEDFVKANPFAFISGCDANNQPIATQIPVFFEDKNDTKVLRGHIMKQTDHHKAFLQNPNVLVVFSGKHTYVSGSWYSNPHTPSTWNYMSVHAKGVIRFLDEQALIDILKTTTNYFEGHNPDSPTIYDNLPKDYTDRLIKAIVAFEIEVESLDNIFKLSQDRDKESYHNIIAQLQNQGEDSKVIAKEMEKRVHQLFKS